MSEFMEHESSVSFADYIGSGANITGGKLPIEEIFRVAGRLIAVHDQERARIAQELHDDIGASLATLGIGLFGLGQPTSTPARGRQDDIQAIYEELQEIGSRLSHLSNQLRPSVLKHFGLAKAIEAECRKASEQWHIPVSCSCSPLPAGLDPIFQLNFFKILQEALHNAGRHSHASSIAVSLTVSPDELILEVSDDGIGFDMKQVPLGGGLGLITVGVRVRLIGGQAEVRSRPGQGTRVVCRAPLASSEPRPGGSREEKC